MTIEVVFSGSETASDDPLMVAWTIQAWVRLFLSVFYDFISLSPFPSANSLEEYKHFMLSIG